MIEVGEAAEAAPRGGLPFRPLVLLGAVVIVGLPLIVALVALTGARWHPVLDLAMTELRVRDVGTPRTPLIGLPGRIGEYPDQGSHPGPLSFYLVAPTYRLFGSSSWALQAGTVVVHLLAVATALWIGHRRGGWRGVMVIGFMLALAIRGYGQVALTQPWNPYLPLLAWIVVLLATWSVLCGDHRMLIPLVVAGSICAQTHVPYGLLVTAMGLLALLAVLVQRHRAAPARRGAIVSSLLWALGIGVVLWLPPMIDQLINRPGNVRTLLDHFATPPEPAVGVGEGVRLALEHLDVWSGLARQVVTTGTFFDESSAVRGAVVLVVWTLAAIVAARRGSASLRALHVVIGVALVAGTLSMARIFGLPWFYLMLWAWAVMLAAMAAIVWTGIESWSAVRSPMPDEAGASGCPPSEGERGAGGKGGEGGPGRWAVVGAAGAALVSVATAAAFAHAEAPEERLSQAVGALSDPTYEALAKGVGAAVGKDGAYQVRWSDAADIGSPGMGLLNELERRGLDVAADAYFDVPMTKYRVRARDEADAQVHLATGVYIDGWRTVPGAVEVAAIDRRTDAERAQYQAIRASLVERLSAQGFDELVPLVDLNLFGASLDPRLSDRDREDFGRLIDLGQPMAVFIAPPLAELPAPSP